MIDVFWWYIAMLIFVAFMVFILVLYKFYIGNQYTQAANKLKSMMANIRRDYPSIGQKPQQLVEDSLEGMGVDGIIDSLGLPKFITPFIKGFVSNPENIKKILELLKSKGINIPLGEQTKEPETPLL